MVSVNTNASSAFILSSLRQTNADLQATQNRIASGLKVSSARDNASVWATAQSIRKDITAQDTVNASVALAKGQADIAYAALTTMGDILTKIQTASAGLKDANAVNVAVQKEITGYQQQLMAVAQSASLQGVNLLTGAAGAVTTTIGQDSGSPITLTFAAEQVLNAAGDAGTLGSGTAAAFTSIYATAFTGTSTAVNIGAFTGALTTAIASVTAYTARIGNYADTLGSQQDFLTKINDIRTTAVGALVDADMEKESANISALQVKQQLAYQALSITSNSAQNILRLFQ